MMERGRAAMPTRLDAAVFLIGFAVMMLELLLTRIFSVTLFYHLSFLVVSLAMLGLGAGAVFVYLWPRLFVEAPLMRTLAMATLAFAISTILAVGVAIHVEAPLSLHDGGWRRLVAIYCACSVPFLAAGLALALILTCHSEIAHRLYAFDLVGAALGCVAFIPATSLLGAPTAVVATAGVALLAAALLSTRQSRAVRGAVLSAAAALAVLAAIGESTGLYDVHVSRGQRQSGISLVRWNSFSRVELIGSPDGIDMPHAPKTAGISRTLDPGFRVREATLRYDGDAATVVTAFDGNVAGLIHLAADVSGAAYIMGRADRVLVMGAGGGREVLTALHFGSRDIEAVEINGLTIELLKGPLRSYVGGLYSNYPGVRVIEGDARAYLRGTREQYDVIQASLLDTWAASSAGAFALTEHSLYTVEAFEDYLRHLRPNGIVAFSRWYHDPPLEIARVAELAGQAYRRLGVSDCGRHVLVVMNRNKAASLGTVLFKRSAFDEEERAALRQWAGRLEFEVIYDAERGGSGEEDFALIQRALQASAQLGLVSAATDDRPFFFIEVPLLPLLFERISRQIPFDFAGSFGNAERTLFVALIGTGIAALLLGALPFALGRSRWRSHGVPHWRAALWVSCAAGLGLGYITIEIVFLQRFSLFLGHPTYSLSVVLFSMLVSTGIGSALARRASTTRALVRFLLIVFAAVVVAALAVPAVTRVAHGASTLARAGIVIALVSPLALLMGMPFPTALRRAGSEAPDLVSWAWAVNGGTSVFGSTLSVAVSTAYGFSVSFAVGVAAYVVALAAALGLAMLPSPSR